MPAVVGPEAMPSTSAGSLVQNLSTTVSTTSGTSLLPSSPLQLLTLPFRILHRAETFAFNTVPRHVARLAGMEDIGMSLWGGAAPGLADDAVATASQAAAGLADEGVAQAMGQGDSWYVTEFLQTMRKLGGFFGYLTSIWSFACLVEVSSVQVISRALLRIVGSHTQPDHDLCIDQTASATGLGEATGSTHHSDPSLRVANIVLTQGNTLSNVALVP